MVPRRWVPQRREAMAKSGERSSEHAVRVCVGATGLFPVHVRGACTLISTQAKGDAEPSFVSRSLQEGVTAEDEDILKWASFAMYQGMALNYLNTDLLTFGMIALSGGTSTVSCVFHRPENHTEIR